MTAPISPTGGCPDPAGRGSHYRDAEFDALVRAVLCLTPFPRDRWCLRARFHAPGCIAYGPFPRTDISDDNPRYVRSKA